MDLYFEELCSWDVSLENYQVRQNKVAP